MNYIIPASSKVYDHQGAFDKFGSIDWRQGNSTYNVGDIVYIYQGVPLKKISHKTRVVEVNKLFHNIQDDSEFFHDKKEFEKAKDGKYFRLELIETIDGNELELLNLLNNGLKGAPQGKLSLDNDDKENLLKFIESAFNNVETHFPETADTSNCIEGAIKTITVNKYERSTEARNKCIKHHGCTCKVCGLNFKEMYGVIGEGFIHVHHIKPLCEIKEGYEVDPVNDLIPVCPNCHAMLHKKLNGKSISVNDLANIIK